jgi:3-phenylpropionate/trans-cinnamate dioxygenase ferredoxin subunit
MADVTVCTRADVAPGTAKRFDVEGARLCVVNIPNKDGTSDYYVIGDECSHADYSLSEGDVWEDECEIECPKHGSTFSLTTGEPQTLPATQPVPVYAVRVDGDDVVVTIP